MMAAVLGAGVWSACGQASATETPPPPNSSFRFGLHAVTDSTFSVSVRWDSVVWHGRTITHFRRVVQRQDTAQNLRVYGLDDNALITALNSDSFTLPLPDPGPTGNYNVCLYTVDDSTGHQSKDGGCDSFAYTRTDTLPPAPGGVQASPDTVGTVALGDTLHLVLDSLTVALAGYDSLDTATTFHIDTGSTRQALAVWWQGDQPIGCFAASLKHASDCSMVGIARAPVMVRNGQNLYLAGWDSATSIATLVPGLHSLSLAMATAAKARALRARAESDPRLPWRATETSLLASMRRARGVLTQ
jgi:hypothetical protein